MTDPFAEVVELPRNGRGNPMIMPLMKRGGKPDLKAKLAPYTRVSTFAKALDDAGGLIKYNVRAAVLGVGRNPDLAALAGVYGPTIADLSAADKTDIDAIAERAHDRVGGNAKADYGTAIHALTEPDRDPFAPETMQPDVAAYQAALAEHGIEVVSSEQFIVCDELQVAGTFDHAYRLTRDITVGETLLPAGTVMIGDKKTGGLHFVSQAIQLAIYAHGKTYDVESGERAAQEVSTAHAILAHIPNGEAKATLYLIDIVAGWEAAKLAKQARDLNSAAGQRKLGQAFPTAIQNSAESGAVLVETPSIDEPAPKRDIYAECQATEAKIKAGRLAKEIADGRAFTEGVEQAKARANAKLIAKREADKEAAIVARAEAAAARAVAAEREGAEAAKTITNLLGAEPILTIEQQIAAAANRDELAAIWRQHKPLGTWTDAHTALMQARDKETRQAA